MIEDRYGRGTERLEISPTFLIDDKPALKAAMESMTPTVLFNGPWGCLSGDTEYLTPNGWKRLDGFSDGDLNAEFDLKTGRIEFRPPKHFIKLSCDFFYHLKNRDGFDQLVSPEHTILFTTRYAPDKWQMISAETLVRGHNALKDGWSGRIPTIFRAPDQPGVHYTDDEIRLLVAISADGCFWNTVLTRYCRISIHKDRKKKRLRELLSRCGIEWKESKTKNRPTNINFTFYAPDRTKDLWDLFTANEKQLLVVVDEFPLWDGYISKIGNKRFSSCNEANADFIQYALTCSGIRATISRVNHPDKPNWNSNYEVYGNVESPDRPLRGAKNIEKVPSFDGWKYCFSTQTGFFVARRNGKIFVTGNSGKTRLIGEKAYYLCRKYPKYKVALVRKELRHLKRTVWKSLIDKVIPTEVLRASYYNKSDVEIKFLNGSEIHGCGLDDPHKLASTEYGFIGLEEAIEITDELSFTWIESRARQPEAPFHQVMYACNAGAPAHYLYRHFFLERPKDEAGNPLTEVIQGNVLWDLLPASYKARLNALKGRYRDRFVHNKWIGYEGLIYDVFNPAEHIVSRFPIPKDWQYVMAIDFGFNEAFVCQFWAVSPDDVWYLDKEIYYSHRTVNKHVPQIKELLKDRNVTASYSDHDSEDQATLEEHGIRTIKADKSVSPGIQKVYDMMSNNQIFFFEDALVEKDPILEMNGKPTCTVEEVQGYIWMNNQKEQPKKENDHGIDAKRYGIYSYHSGVQRVPGSVSLGIVTGPPQVEGVEKPKIELPKEYEWVKKNY